MAKDSREAAESVTGSPASHGYPPVFVTLAVDQVERSVIVVGFAANKAECCDHRDRVDTPYVKTFEIADDLGSHMYAWFRTCGVSSREATDAIRGVGRELSEMLCSG